MSQDAAPGTNRWASEDRDAEPGWASFRRMVDYDHEQTVIIPDPCSASSLYKDDLSIVGFSISSYVQMLMLHARESLITAMHLAASDYSPIWSLYSVLRPSLESSATAFWLMESPSRKERIRRFHRFILNDIQRSKKLISPLGKDLPPSGALLELMEAEIEIRMSAMKLGTTSIKALPDATRLLEILDSGTPGPGDRSFFFCWSMCSSMSHGHTEALFASLDPENQEYFEANSSMASSIATGGAMALWRAEEEYRRVSLTEYRGIQTSFDHQF